MSMWLANKQDFKDLYTIQRFIGEQCRGGLKVRALTFYSDDSSLNPAYQQFCCKIVLEIIENYTKGPAIFETDFAGENVIVKKTRGAV